MSVHLTSHVWKMEGLLPAAKLVLLKLADNANDEGTCWPSVRRICRETGCARSTVQKHVADFEAAGWLTRQQREESSNIFTLTLPALSEGGARLSGGARSSGGGGPADGRGGPDKRAGGARSSGTEPSDEPSDESSKEPKASFSKNNAAKGKQKQPAAPALCAIILEQLPAEFSSHPAFALRLGEFIGLRCSKATKMTGEAARRLGLKLAKYSADTGTEALENSLERGWSGVFPESVKKAQPGQMMSGKGKVEMMGDGATPEEIDELF